VDTEYFIGYFFIQSKTLEVEFYQSSQTKI
jgi:hypothetical protein